MPLPLKTTCFPDSWLSAVDFGAVRDGRTDSAPAFNAAIAACSKNGGGHVIVPAGCYLSTSIHLLSNVDFHLETGAVILFSRVFSDYPLIMSHFEGYPSIRSASPLWADGAENIAVTGDGILDGNGDAWWSVKRWEQTDAEWSELLERGGYVDDKPGLNMWWPTESAKLGRDYFIAHHGLVSDFDVAERYHPFFRPCLLEIKRSSRVLIDGITVQNSPAWSVHTMLCDNVRVNRLHSKAPWDAPNTDGLNLECTQYAEVTDCVFDVGDDALCVKSGRNAEGRKIGVPTRHIHISGCKVNAAHGGFTVGSETACGIEDVLVENCVFNGSDRGLRLKSCLGRGGLIRDIVMRDITMHNIRKEAVTLKISEDLLSMPNGRPEYAPEDYPEFRNILMENIICRGAGLALEVCSLPGVKLSDIILRNADFTAVKDMSVSLAKGFSLENVSFTDARGGATARYERLELQ